MLLLMVAGAPRWGSVACAQSLTGSGTEEDPYLIKSASDWSTFRSDINGGYHYEGKFVKLTKNIQVGNVYYTSDINHKFKGTFDGDGHTIKVAIEDHNSLFSRVENATIKNLRVTGSYNSPDSENGHTGGLVYESEGDVTIENCIVSASIIAYKDCGGFVCRLSSPGTLTIQNCLFLGKLQQYGSAEGYQWGGFVGFGRDINSNNVDKTYKNYIRNSLFRPNTVSVSSPKAKTFTCRINQKDDNSVDDVANFITNCFYFTQLGGAQGTNANITSNANILTGLGDSWTRNDDFFYLKTWCKNVDISGWVEGATAKSPTLEDNYECLDGEVTYAYKSVDGSDSFSETVPSTAGHYTVRATILDGWKSTKNFWIVTSPTAKTGLKYNGSDQSLVSADNNTTDAGTYYYRVGTDGSWSTDIPTGKEVKTYTVYYYVKSTDTNDHHDIGSESSPAGSVEVEISSSSEDGFTFSAEDCTYDGTEKKPAVTVKYGDAEVSSTEYTVSYSNNINAGTGTVTFTDVVGGTYTVNGTATFTIKRKPLSPPAVKVSPTSMTYTGSGLQPDVTVYDNDTELATTEYTVTYKNNTDVGTGEVLVSDKSGGNYEITTTTANFTITKATLGCTAPTAKSPTYNGKAQELVSAGTITGAGNTSGCTMMYSTDGTNYSSSLPTGKDAKTYTVYYKVTGDKNHKDIAVSSISATITSKKLTNPTVVLSPSSYTYDGTAKEPDVTVYDGETEVSSSEYTVKYSNNVRVGTGVVTLRDVAGGNYTISGTAEFSIVSGNSEVVSPQAKKGLVYNRHDQELVTAGSVSGGTMLYSLDNQTYSMKIPTGKDAKAYKVWFKVKGDEDHADRDPVSLNVSIAQKEVTLLVTLTGVPEALPMMEVLDDQGELMGEDEYEYEIRDSNDDEVSKNSKKVTPGEYVIKVWPTGNFKGPSIATTFHVRRSYSFVFNMESDIIGVCLPFNRDVPAGYEVYCFSKMDDDGNPVFKQKEMTQMNAGEPYLLRYVGEASGTRDSRKLDLSPSSPGLIDMSTQIQAQANKKMVFTGTFADLTNTRGLTDHIYILKSDRSWKPLDSTKVKKDDGVCLEAFQTYICFKEHTTPYSKLQTSLVDVNGKPVDQKPIVSGIPVLILEDEEGRKEWFDLNGRRIDAPQKGINILRTEDGRTRKVIIR